MPSALSGLKVRKYQISKKRTTMPHNQTKLYGRGLKGRGGEGRGGEEWEGRNGRGGCMPSS